MRSRRFLSFSLVAGAALRVSWQSWFAADPSSWFPHGNAAGFIRVARMIVSGDVLAGREPFFYGPLYPYYLAACFTLAGSENLFLPRALQAVLGLAIAVLGWRIARRAFDPAAALAAAGLLLVYGPGLFFEGLLVAETLSTFLLLLAIDLASRALEAGVGAGGRSTRVVLAGAALALSACGRGNVLLLLPVVAVLVWAGARHAGARPRAALLPAFLLAAGAAAVILPVGARNLWVGGDRVLLVSQGGINFFLGNNPEARGWFGLAERAGITTDVDGEFFANTKRVADAVSGRSLLPSEVSRHWFRRSLAWMREAPGAAARLWIRKTLLLLEPYELPIHRTSQYYFARFPLGFLLPGWGLLLPFAVAGLVLLPRPRAMAVGLAAVAAAYAATVVAFFVCDRYRFPLVPLLAPFAGLAIARIAEATAALVRRKRPRHLRRVSAALAVVAVTALGVNNHPGREWLIPAEIRAGFLAIEHNRHGLAWERLGDPAAALTAYEQALQIAPGHVDSRLRQAAILIDLGRSEEARAILETLLALRPDLDEARLLLAHADELSQVVRQ